MLKRLPVFVGVLALIAPLAAQPPLDPGVVDVYAKIRQEANDHSQIMRTLHVLTDVYGPRVTGSPNLKAAGEWAIKQMESWGFTNGHLEPWDFGHPGWVERALLGPHRLAGQGSARGRSPRLDARHQRHGDGAGVSADRCRTADADGADGVSRRREETRCKGKIVLVGKHTVVPVNLTPPAKRRADDQVRAQYDPNNPNAGPVRPRRPRRRVRDAPPPMTTNEINRAGRRVPRRERRAGPRQRRRRASTARSSRSTTGRSISPRRCRPW